MDDWLKEIEMCGHTYTLESTYQGKAGHESASYA